MKTKYVIVLIVFVLTLVVGCKAKEEPWDYKTGFVVAKENGRVLVVREKPAVFRRPINEKPFTRSKRIYGVVNIEEILKDAGTDAIWLSVDKNDYDVTNVADQVTINIANEVIDQSDNPAQATADIKTMSVLY